MLAKNKSLQIVLLGSGNVATQLGLALKKAGHNLLMVYSPNGTHAKQLAHKLNSKHSNKLSDVPIDAQLYLIAVKDDAIALLAKQLVLKDKMILHTSGSTSIHALGQASVNYGVLYPLQTITKQKTIDFGTVPFCIEAANPKTRKMLTALAKSLSNQVYYVSSEHRLLVHLAAVFACNFSNYMYSIAETILKESNISFNILKPLILETASRISNASPLSLQTGPAARGDEKTIANHLKLLTKKKQYQQVYKLLSENIIKEKNKL